MTLRALDWAATGSRLRVRRDPRDFSGQQRLGGFTRGNSAHRAAGRGAGGGTGLQAVLALAPHGDAVAFEWYRDGDWQIFVKSLPDGEPVRVGDLADRCGCPQFSPDGRSLYFTCDDRGSECYDIYRYDVDSGAVVNLLPDTPDLAPLPDPDLSPDGSQLAMTVSHGAGYAVAVMPAQPSPGGSPLRYLTEHPYTECSPRWSPDGTLLAVTTGTRGQDTAIAVIDVESGESRWVGGSDEFFAGQLAWSPDGRRLAFAGGPGDHPGDRRLRARHRLHHLGVGRPPRRRPQPRVGARRRRARVPRRRGGRDRPLPHRPARRGRDRVQHRPRQPLRAELHPGRRRPGLRPQPARRPRRPVPGRAGRRRRDRRSPTRCRRSCARRRSSPAAPSGSRAGTTSPRCPASSSSRTSPTGPPSSSSTAARPGTTPTSGTRCARRSWPPASPCCTRTTAAATATAAAGSSPTAGSWARARCSTWRPRTSSSSGWAATRRASRSPVAAGAASTPWPPSPSSPTCGPPASPASPSSTSSTASSTRASARTCAGGTARTPGTSSATGRGWSTTRPSTTSRAWRRRSCSSAAPSTPAARRGRSPRSRRRCARAAGSATSSCTRRGPRDQRPRAPRRLRPAHGRLHPGAHRLRLRPASGRRPDALPQRCEIR